MFSAYPVGGIALAISGNILISVALNIQRYAHTRNIRENGHQSKASAHGISYIRDGIWWLGVCIMTMGEIGNFVAYGIAPASIVSPLGVFALISNCFVAPVFFNERLHLRDLSGIVTSTCGVLFVIFSVQADLDGGHDDEPEPEGPLRNILNSLKQRSFILYVIVTSSIMVVLLAFMFAVPISTSSRSRHDQVLRAGVRTSTNTLDNEVGAEGVIQSNQDPSIVHESYEIVDGRRQLPQLLGNILLVALLGAYTALSTKCLSELLRYNFGQALLMPVSYVLLAVLLCTAALQVYFLNRALKIFPATTVIPVHFALFTISVIVGSQITFHDFDGHDAGHNVMFIFGCILTFAGVWLIASGPSSPGAVPPRGAAFAEPSDLETVASRLDTGGGSPRHASSVEGPIVAASGERESSPLLSYGDSRSQISEGLSPNSQEFDGEIARLSPPTFRFALTGPGVYIGTALHAKRSQVTVGSDITTLEEADP